MASHTKPLATEDGSLEREGDAVALHELRKEVYVAPTYIFQTISRKKTLQVLSINLQKEVRTKIIRRVVVYPTETCNMVRSKFVESDLAKERTKKSLSVAKNSKKWSKEHLSLCGKESLRQLKHPVKVWNKVFQEVLHQVGEEHEREQTVVSAGAPNYLRSKNMPDRISRKGKEALSQALLTFSDDYFRVLTTVVSLNGRQQPIGTDTVLAQFVMESRAGTLEWRSPHFTDTYLERFFEHEVSEERKQFGDLRAAVLKSCRAKGVSKQEGTENHAASEPAGETIEPSSKKQLKLARKEFIVPKKKCILEHLSLVVKQAKHSTEMKQAGQCAGPWTSLIHELADSVIRVLREDTESAMQDDLTASLLNETLLEDIRKTQGIGEIALGENARISKQAFEAICEAALDYLHQHFVYMDVISAIRGKTTLTTVDLAIAKLAINAPDAPLERPLFTETFLDAHDIPMPKVHVRKVRSRKQANPKKRVISRKG